jgi:hypothetical protein
MEKKPLLQDEDIIAIILIIGVFIIHYHAHMEWHVALIFLIATYYFGNKVNKKGE